MPNRYRHLTRVELRYASWDLSLVHLVDERTGKVLFRLFPQDKIKNASGLRRPLDPVSSGTRQRQGRRRGYRRFWPRCSASRKPQACRPPISPRTKEMTETKCEQEAAGALRAQVEPFRSRRADRGAPRHAAHRLLLLAGRAARPGGRLRSRDRESGTGKSITLRILTGRLAALRDVKSRGVQPPQVGIADFYREMGDLFSGDLRPAQSLGRIQALRERWKTHIEPPVTAHSHRRRSPGDAAAVLGELRLLSSVRLDSHILLDRRVGRRRPSAGASQIRVAAPARQPHACAARPRTCQPRGAPASVWSTRWRRPAPSN